MGVEGLRALFQVIGGVRSLREHLLTVARAAKPPPLGPSPCEERGFLLTTEEAPGRQIPCSESLQRVLGVLSPALRPCRGFLGVLPAALVGLSAVPGLDKAHFGGKSAPSSHL